LDDIRKKQKPVKVVNYAEYPIGESREPAADNMKAAEDILAQIRKRQKG